MRISGQTQITGIIGNPVEHTLTPAMLNTAYKSAGLDCIHVAFDVDSDRVDEAVKSIRAMKIKGMIVTMPHKLSVIPFLDELDPLTRTIGAVNVIINNNGILKGYNFDAPGFMHPLLEMDFQPQGKNVTVLGAGGGARAVTFALAEKGANLTILNRHSGPAAELAKSLSQFSGKEVKSLDLTEENLKDAISAANLLVNTTSVGLNSNPPETLVPIHLIRPDLIVYDIISSPLYTQLLLDARKQGAQIIPGIHMAVQNILLFFIAVTGMKPSPDLMTRIVEDEIKTHEKSFAETRGKLN